MEIAFHKLGTSVGVPGPHGFAVRKLLQSSKELPTSIAACPAFDTFAKRPSHRDRMGIFLEVICSENNIIFFPNGLDKRLNF